MHHANHFYGHAHIMARYAGLSTVPRIFGYLQHGWNTWDGFAVGTPFAPNYPKFVWSEAVARRGWATGLRNYAVVGSPWAYLLLLERQREWDMSDPQREGTIVYPFHGWEGQKLRGSHADYLAEIREVEGDVPLTICLYFDEYRDPKIRAAYEEEGVRVISHGQRGHSYRNTDAEFLYRQLTELRRHRRAVSNRMGSALFYAASTGAEVGVYGDPMVLEGDHAVLGGMAKQLRLWPEMHQKTVPTDIARDYATSELGIDVRLSPAEIRRLFQWKLPYESESTKR